jgi:tetratricopeptide (TPR) repeat protein
MGLVSARLGYGRERRTALLSQGVERARAANDHRTLANGLLATAFNLNIQGRYDESLVAVREALEYARSSRDRRLLAQGLLREAMSVFPGDIAQGRKLFDEAIALFAACDDADGSCITLMNRAESEFQTADDPREALRFAETAVPFAQAVKIRPRLVTLYANKAAYHLLLNEVDEARESARQSLSLAREAQSWQTAAFDVQHLAEVALRKGDLRTAARLIGWCDARLKVIDEIRQPTEQHEYEQIMEDLQKALSPEKVQSLSAEGSMLSEDAAYEEALRV